MRNLRCRHDQGLSLLDDQVCYAIYSAGLIARARNPNNERQVVVILTPQGQALKARASCVGERLLATSGHSMEALG